MTGLAGALSVGAARARPPLGRPFASGASRGGRAAASLRRRALVVRAGAEGGGEQQQPEQERAAEQQQEAAPPRRRRGRRAKKEEGFTLQQLNPYVMGRKSREVFDDVWTQLQRLGSTRSVPDIDFQ